MYIPIENYLEELTDKIQKDYYNHGQTIERRQRQIVEWYEEVNPRHSNLVRFI